jgi:FKBP-type peptidyl-prolyl cis-trans isomerase 2
VIEDGRKVSIEYTLKLDDDRTADSNVGQEPLVYQQGAQQILPGVEREVSDMQVEETRDFVLSPDEGYGRVNPELRQEVRTDVVPEQARHEGAELVSSDGAGNRRIVRVHEVRDEHIVLDLNHPLAGKNLHFRVRLLGIE